MRRTCVILWNWGTAIAIKIAVTARTTSTSSKVKPRVRPPCLENCLALFFICVLVLFMLPSKSLFGQQSGASDWLIRFQPEECIQSANFGDQITRFDAIAYRNRKPRSLLPTRGDG